DPATGSAAAGLGMALVAAGRLPEGGRYTITQGVEMGRPSTLEGRVEVASGAVSRVHVAGGVRAVASGRVVVPAG
ncbi:MAG: PhzF family phenazine biosynthesis protein, partial [Actinomycetes bacterium]|nr:PhzF family phenazine biosynthesis protein [Actinomycetes bacterium]